MNENYNIEELIIAKIKKNIKYNQIIEEEENTKIKQYIIQNYKKKKRRKKIQRINLFIYINERKEE